MPSDGQFEEVRTNVERARRADAYRCAPRELAMAQGNLEFAQAELDLGDVVRAQEHLAEAKLNARAALARAEDGCAQGSLAATPERDLRQAPPTTDDRDGDGIADRVDLCPDQAEDMDGTVDRDGCPDPDNDADGVPDTQDNCPDSAEDNDGFEDEDGCPEVDNDGDGVLDGEDACPLARGSARALGCPLDAYQGATLDERGIELSTRVSFAERSTKLSAGADTVLDVIARMLRDRPTLSLELAVHSDSRGDDEQNLALTQQQADALKQALVQRGVEPARLTAKGYGETRPLESNRTSSGRSANRRVEFLRTDLSP